MRPPTRPERRACAALAAALALVGACSEPAPPRALRVLEAELERYVPPAPLPARRVLFAGTGAAPDSWWPLARIGEQPSPEDLERFHAAARVEPDGRVVLGGRGSWLQLVPVEPGATLLASAALSVRGVRGEPRELGARLGLVELAELPARGDLAAARDALIATHWSDPVRGDREDVGVTLVVRATAETRVVGILCTQQLDLDPTEPHATFDAVELVLPGARGYVAEAAGRDVQDWSEDEPLRGRYTIAATSRRGIAVPAGAAARYRLRAPEGPARVELFAGLVPHDELELLDEVEFWCEVGLAGGPMLASWRRSAPSLGLDDARWHSIEGDLPAAMHGEDVWVQLRTSTAPAARGFAIPVFAEPRIVPADPARVGPNLVLVSIDTLRADRLGCYGYERDTSPSIDAFARTATVFADTWAQSPYTLPSHVSMFSGQFPSFHGVQKTEDVIDPQRTRLLARILRERGYATGAFTGGAYLHPVFELDRGFDRYGFVDPAANIESATGRSTIEAVPGMTADLYRESSIDAVVGWMERHADQSFFLFVHTYAAHEFDPPAEHLAAIGSPLRGREDAADAIRYLYEPIEPPPEAVAQLDDLYDGAVRQADAAVGRLLDGLERLGLADDTVVVITSDHGKEIGEHGLIGHGHSLYEELVGIPLLVRVPGRPPASVAEPAMLVDIVPTVLAALDVPPPPHVQGVDLFSERPSRVLFAEVDGLAHKAALRHGPIKTIWSPLDANTVFVNEIEEETFDLAADPHERAPLAPDPDRIERVTAFQESLRQLSAAAGGDADADARVLGEQAGAHLKALGYLAE